MLLPQSFWYSDLSEGADCVCWQVRGDKECPFSGVTISGRVWRMVPETDVRSVHWLMPSRGTLWKSQKWQENNTKSANDPGATWYKRHTKMKSSSLWTLRCQIHSCTLHISAHERNKSAREAMRASRQDVASFRCSRETQLKTSGFHKAR